MREEYRDQNLKRIRDRLVKYRHPCYHQSIRVCWVCPHGVLQWRPFIIGWVHTGFMADPERHEMVDMETPQTFGLVMKHGRRAGVTRAEADKLVKDAASADRFDRVTIPTGEEYDGPPIYDLTNEEEIFAAIDSMIPQLPPKEG